MAAEYMNDDDILVAYRSAINGIGRDMQLLTITGVSGELSGASYGAMHESQKWEASFCPLSTNDIALDSNNNRWLVFETKGRIQQLNLSNSSDPSRVGPPFTETRQKNPAIAFNNFITIDKWLVMLNDNIVAVAFETKICRYFVFWIVGSAKNPIEKVKFSRKIFIDSFRMI